MSKSQQTFNKKEREKKRRKRKESKREKRQQRKLEKSEAGKKSFEDQLSYVDEFGNLSSTPPDPKTRNEIKAEDIVLGVSPQERVPDLRIRKGIVKFFNVEKSYGFITDLKTQDSVFVHANDLTISLKENDKVIFEVEKGPKGLVAVNVKFASVEK